jgi:zinc transporter
MVLWTVMENNPGLVCGYRVDRSGEMSELGWADIDSAIAMDDALIWLHFDQINTDARNWITHCPHIPDGAKSVLLGTDSHMRIESVGAGLCGVVGDLHHEFAQTYDRLDVLRLYLDNRCLISARQQSLASIEKLRKAIGEGLKVDRPIAIIIHFLHHVTDTLGDLILGLADSVDSIEESILDGKGSQSGDELSRIRRVAARLRRHMVPQQHALLGLLSRLPPWIAEAEAVGLRNAIERLAALGHDLELIQERARLLQEQASARLMEATNRNLYILSIVTTIFLPITLITGVFGMNLGGLPAQQDPIGFWYGIGIMIVTVGATLFLLRRYRIL